jgi:hypothetical protein
MVHKLVESTILDAMMPSSDCSMGTDLIKRTGSGCQKISRMNYIMTSEILWTLDTGKIYNEFQTWRKQEAFPRLLLLQVPSLTCCAHCLDCTSSNRIRSRVFEHFPTNKVEKISL